MRYETIGRGNDPFLVSQLILHKTFLSWGEGFRFETKEIYVSPDPDCTLNKSYSNNNRESIDQEWRHGIHLFVTHRCEEITCAWVPRLEIRLFILICYNPYRTYAVGEFI